MQDGFGRRCVAACPVHLTPAANEPNGTSPSCPALPCPLPFCPALLNRPLRKQKDVTILFLSIRSAPRPPPRRSPSIKGQCACGCVRGRARPSVCVVDTGALVSAAVPPRRLSAPWLCPSRLFVSFAAVRHSQPKQQNTAPPFLPKRLRPAASALSRAHHAPCPFLISISIQQQFLSSQILPLLSLSQAVYIISSSTPGTAYPNPPGT